MAELRHRLAALHPKARYLEIVIRFSRIDAQHEALPNLATVLVTFYYKSNIICPRSISLSTLFFRRITQFILSAHLRHPELLLTRLFGET